MAVNRYGVIVALMVAWLCAISPVAVAQSVQPIPQLTGRVVDQAAMLAGQSRASLEAKLEEHERKTGNQIAVLTIQSLNGEALEDYSIRVARGWALGQKDRNNGVLFLIARDDRKIRIEVGYGLEGTLTDAIASFIIRATVTPLFKQGLFDGGIVAGTGQIIEVLESDQAALDEWKNRAKPNEDGSESKWPIFVFVGMWLMIMFGGIFAKMLARTFGRQVKPGHWRWLGIDAGPNAPKPKRSSSSSGGGWSSGGGGGGFSGGGGSFGGGGSSGGW